MKPTAQIALVLLMGVLGCDGSGEEAGPTAPPSPSGPAPSVEVTLGFGDAPVEGTLFLTPPPGSENWRYSVDLDGDGTPDHEGILGLRIGFRYRFAQAGIHSIRTVLRGPDEHRQDVESLVIVNDQGPLRIIAANRVQPLDPMWVSFEGITTSSAGDAIYVANYSGGSLHRLDPTTLSVTGVIEEMSYSIEGLVVSPLDSFLFATYKYTHVAVVDLHDFEIERFQERAGVGGFFIHGIDERRALLGGGNQLSHVDMRNGAVLDVFRAPGDDFTYTWHFDVTSDGGRAAVIVRGEHSAIHIVDPAIMESLGTVPLGPMEYPQLVAFDPSGTRLYVMGNTEEGEALFVAYHLATGTILRSLRLGRSYCSGYCVANPTATIRSGRYVAFEWNGGAYFIDTELDLPRYATQLPGSNVGFSVSASPIEDVFYFLRSDGLIQKLTIDD